MKRNFIRLLIVLVILNALISSGLALNALSKDEVRDQSEATALVQAAIYYYWNDGDVQKSEHEIFKGITIQGKMDAVEKLFKEASALEPARMEYYFSIASAQLRQNKQDQALATLAKVLQLDPGNFQARFQILAYSKIMDKVTADDFKVQMDALAKLNKAEGKKYADLLGRVEKSYELKINTAPPADYAGEDVAIVVLGYALAPDGTMQETLLERLQQAYNLANHYTDAKIIVSGGVAKGGVTEAFRMKEWLVDNGIAKSRIFMDYQSRDTVENAFYCCRILQRLAVKKVIIVSSASHIRRAVAVFDEQLLANGQDVKTDNMVYLDYPTAADAAVVNTTEKMLILQDVLRASGWWAYPGIQR